MIGARSTTSLIAGALLGAAMAVLTGVQPVHAQSSGESKPYDDRLMRLSEILGAVHYLRELCGASDGQLWRDRMQELMTAEGTTALRRARLTRSFNQGYRSYSRTYSACSPSAQNAITRFAGEAVQLAENLLKTP